MNAKISLLIFTFAGLVTLTSCATKKPSVSAPVPERITELAVIEPVAHISYIEKGNDPQYSDSLSNRSRHLVRALLETVPGMPVISRDIYVDDGYEDMVEDIYFLYNTLCDAPRGSVVAAPEGILSLLSEGNQRYGLIVMTEGFTRRKGNYGGQTAKSLAIGILTLGMYVPVAVKSHSFVACIIVDRYTGNVAFFGKSVGDEKEPLEAAHLSKQLDRIFRDFFVN